MNASFEGGEGVSGVDDDVDIVVEVLRLLADPTRVRVLLALHDGELSVGDLAGRLGKPVPAVSQHLAKLRMARLVRTRREGTRVHYRVGNEHVLRLLTDALHHADHLARDVPRHHAEGTRERSGIRAVRP
jgi:DNA-binding transcriptional ArsR family regulator